MASRRLRKRKNNNVIRIADNGLGRVYIHYCCIGNVDYFSCMGVDSVTASRPEPEYLYCPSDSSYGKFDIIGAVPGEKSTYTSSINTYLTLDDVSFMKRFFDLDCEFNISIHYGECDSPKDFYSFDKMLLLKNVRITDYDLSSLVALQAGDRQQIDETVGVSFEDLLVFLPYSELSETRIENVTVNSFSILRDNTCNSCTACAICYCSNLGLATNGLQNAIVSWQNRRDQILFVSDIGSVQGINATEYIENQSVVTEVAYAISLEVGDTVSVGTYQHVGTTLGHVYHIADNNVVTEILDTNGVAITSLYHKENNDILIGTADGSLYTGNAETIIANITSPTTDQISAVAICDNNYLVGTNTGLLYSSVDGANTWQSVAMPSDGSAVLSIECCDCVSFFVGTENNLFYSLDSMQSLEVLHCDYTNYKQILCCDFSQDVTILAEDGTDSIILSTATDESF